MFRKFDKCIFSSFIFIKGMNVITIEKTRNIVTLINEVFPWHSSIRSTADMKKNFFFHYKNSTPCTDDLIISLFLTFHPFYSLYDMINRKTHIIKDFVGST